VNLLRAVLQMAGQAVVGICGRVVFACCLWLV